MRADLGFYRASWCSIRKQMTLAASVAQASMIHAEPVITHSQPTQPLEPTDRPLDPPADLAQATAMRRPPLGDARLDPQPAEQRPQGLPIVAPVGVGLVGQFLGAARYPGVSGGFGRPSESRSPASGRELAARRTIKPGGIRALALSLTARDSFLSIAAILRRPRLTGVTSGI